MYLHLYYSQSIFLLYIYIILILFRTTCTFSTFFITFFLFRHFLIFFSFSSFDSFLKITTNVICIKNFIHKQSSTVIVIKMFVVQIMVLCTQQPIPRMCTRSRYKTTFNEKSKFIKTVNRVCVKDVKIYFIGLKKTCLGVLERGDT